MGTFLFRASVGDAPGRRDVLGSSFASPGLSTDSDLSVEDQEIFVE